MRKRASVFSTMGVILALQATPQLPLIASADEDVGDSAGPARQAGEDRWVPSLAITSGITIQDQRGAAASLLFEDLSPPPVPLREPVQGEDLAVSPFVGAALEVMTPAFAIPSRPRLFLGGEILPTFASVRDLALEGDPGCVRGPEVGAPCAVDEDGSRRLAFGEDAVNGTGTRTSAKVDTLVYGANLGVSFPLQVRSRQLRIKPSVAWINYKVDASGLVVDAACDPVTRCTDIANVLPGFPPVPGFLREVTLAASASQRFNGIGPGLDVEMDTGRFFGWLGTSLFIGGRAYAVLGDRTITFGTSETYDDQIGNDEAAAVFEVEVDPWIFRAHVGIRFQWLGRRL